MRDLIEYIFAFNHLVCVIDDYSLGTSIELLVLEGGTHVLDGQVLVLIRSGCLLPVSIYSRQWAHSASSLKGTNSI